MYYILVNNLKRRGRTAVKNEILKMLVEEDEERNSVLKQARMQTADLRCQVEPGFIKIKLLRILVQALIAWSNFSNFHLL